jgi:hypothetical protein
MSDMTLCRLVVSGAAVDVKRFIRAAATPKPKDKDAGPLSFQRLYPVSDEDDLAKAHAVQAQEPVDCARWPIENVGAARARVDYAFQTKLDEPHGLVRHVSNHFPRLDFLLGAVAPAVDQANCWYFRGGQGKNWKMPDRRRVEIRRRVWKNAGLDLQDEGNLTVDIEGDHAMMEQVVARWTPARKRAALRAMRPKDDK